MGVYEDRKARALELLRAADRRPVTYEELIAAGIDRPAQAIYELELAGYPIEHGARIVRLLSDGDGPEHRRPRR